MKNIIIKKNHSKKCRIAHTKYEFYLASFKSGLMKNYGNDPFFWGTRAGNEDKRGANYQWLLMICNSVDCDFKAVINANVLSDLVKSEIR